MCACRGTAGFAHVSCLAEQAKILVAEAEENNLDDGPFNERWARWHTCSLCEQEYHGVVMGAYGWACWKTYLGRPETDQARQLAMDLLGMGLDEADKVSEALEVSRVYLATIERVRPNDMKALLNCKQNVAFACSRLGQVEEALSTRREVHSIAKAALGPLPVSYTHLTLPTKA